MSPAVAGRSALHPTSISAGMALVLLGAIPASATDLNAVVQASSAQLRRAWAADPGTASLPFPQVVLLPPGVVASGACSPGAPARKPTPRALACVARNQVLLQHGLMATAFNDYNTPAVTYWIAVGHAHQVKPGNIVGAIANEAGLEAGHIGRINIRTNGLISISTNALT